MVRSRQSDVMQHRGQNMTSTKCSSEANAASHHHIREASEGQDESWDSWGSADWREADGETNATTTNAKHFFQFSQCQKVTFVVLFVFFMEMREEEHRDTGFHWMNHIYSLLDLLYPSARRVRLWWCASVHQNSAISTSWCNSSATAVSFLLISYSFVWVALLNSSLLRPFLCFWMASSNDWPHNVYVSNDLLSQWLIEPYGMELNLWTEIASGLVLTETEMDEKNHKCLLNL